MKGFRYNKFKEELSGNDSWGSYSDLFMVLSFVFLMMYVIASLRSGTNSIQQRLETQRIARENQDMKAQMKAYDTLKDSALNKESQEEQEVYNQLMDKLSLLKDEAKNEKENLRRLARENEQKEMALNKYQQVVRNIINANLLAKNKLKVREEIIADKNVKIEDLNNEIESKEQIINKNNQEISKINNDLSRKITELNKAQQNSKITKKKAYEQIAALKKKSLEQISKLNEQNQIAKQQLEEINQNLSQTTEKLTQTENRNQELNQELTETTEKLEETISDYNTQIQKLQAAHRQKMEREKKEFEQKIKSARISSAEKARQLENFKRQVKEKNEVLNNQVKNLQDEITKAEARESAQVAENKNLSQKLEQTVGQYENQIKKMQESHSDKMERERAQFDQKLKQANLTVQEKAKKLAEFNKQAREKDEKLGREIASLKGDLNEARNKANARAKLSKEIAQALRNAGIEADVNPNTGDVLISFGKDYFDNGSSMLKPNMLDVLNKFVPKYSESLFKDPKIADKITSVEIIGFASPTYQGKYIDPHSLSPEDQKAAKYNLDLSYRRARSIFDYMFDTKKIEYKNQKQLLSLVKVTGRSFFTEGEAPQEATPGMSQKEFCMKFDCKKAQKVVIKFNMDDKK